MYMIPASPYVAYGAGGGEKKKHKRVYLVGSLLWFFGI